MPTSSSRLLASLAIALAATPAAAKERPSEFVATLPAPVPQQAEAAATAGSIFGGSYVPLTSGQRAGRPGDVLTVLLVERTSAQHRNSATTSRDGGVGLAPPITGILNLFSPSDVKMSGEQSFKGEGQTAQSNQLQGELSVTVAQVYANGSMLVRGEKLLMLNRGNERVQFSGIVRPADISADNRVLSSRVADARIHYLGKGEIARASRQGWLQRFFSAVSPF